MKRPIIDDELSAIIQKFANNNTNGNFTEAVSVLIKSALLKDKISNNKEGKGR